MRRTAAVVAFHRHNVGSDSRGQNLLGAAEQGGGG